MQQLRRFLGILQYQSRFVINYAREISPLRNLLKKNQKFKWSEEEQTAFERVKELFGHSILLERPKEDEQFIMYTDSSSKAVGAILAQQ